MGDCVFDLLGLVSVFTHLTDMSHRLTMCCIAQVDFSDWLVSFSCSNRADEGGTDLPFGGADTSSFGRLLTSGHNPPARYLQNHTYESADVRHLKTDSSNNQRCLFVILSCRCSSTLTPVPVSRSCQVLSTRTRFVCLPHQLLDDQHASVKAVHCFA